jgi:FSR family fosmidomycin resistance protein-like MFS transporter
MLEAEAGAPAAVTATGPTDSIAVSAPAAPRRDTTVYTILFAICFCHLLNDMMQALVPAIYPLLKNEFHLDFAQVGLITFTWQLMASLLQPAVGLYTDRRPQPYSLAFGMVFTFAGLLLVSVSTSYLMLLGSVALVGVGSSIFHPESSRVARMASGGRYGLAQSIFQVGGNAGTAIGPLMAALIVLPGGLIAVGWFSLAALVAGAVLFQVGLWYARRQAERAARPQRARPDLGLSRNVVVGSIVVLVALTFSKAIYISSISSYFQFYLIEKFHLTMRMAQVFLFVFTGSVAVGTLLGGPLGDRFGRKTVLWASILGALPFTLALPYANLFWTAVLVAVFGLIIASTFSVIIVYAQELLPGKTGLVAGIFFGLSFGLSGLGAAALGKVADMTSITFVYHVCSFLPAIGILVYFLPDFRGLEERR